MDYNTHRNHLIMPEYGRNIQKMVDYAINAEKKGIKAEYLQNINQAKLLNQVILKSIEYLPYHPCRKPGYNNLFLYSFLPVAVFLNSFIYSFCTG